MIGPAQSVEPTLERPLSPAERWYWFADRMSPLQGTVRVRLHGALPDSVLRRALDALQDRHPLLRVAVDDTNGHPRWVRRDVCRIPVRRVRVSPTSMDADSQWQREINERELVEPLDLSRGSSYRVVVVTREAADPSAEVHDVLLTTSHVVADGNSLLSLFEQLIELAARFMGEDGGERPTTDVTYRPVLGATETMLPRRYRGIPGAGSVLSHQLRDGLKALRGRPWRLPASEAVPFERRRTQFVHRSLSPEQVAPLVRQARHHGATVHGALAAAMVTAVARDAAPSRPRQVAIGSPVDFRSDLAPRVSPQDVGNFVATVPSFVELQAGASFWATARAISSDIVARQGRGEHFSTINLLRFICPRRAAHSPRLFRLAEARGPLNVGLSNLGRLELPTAIGPWQMSGLQGVGAISVTGYLIAVVSACQDHLYWNFSYVDGIVPTARAERLATEAVDTLMSAVQAEPR